MLARATCTLSLLVLACSGDPNESASPAESGECGACEIANLEGFCVPNLAGCESTDPYRGYYGDDVGAFAPIESGRGLYIDGGTFDVPAGEEVTRCTYVKLDAPGDFVLGRYEARMKAGSHHFNMLRYEPSVVDMLGIPLGEPIECISAGVPYYVAGSEWQYVDAPLPDVWDRKFRMASCSSCRCTT